MQSYAVKTDIVTGSEFFSFHLTVEADNLEEAKTVARRQVEQLLKKNDITEYSFKSFQVKPFPA